MPKSLKSEPMMYLEVSQESLLVNTIPAEVRLFTYTMPVKLTLFLNTLYSHLPSDREEHLYMSIFLKSHIMPEATADIFINLVKRII